MLNFNYIKQNFGKVPLCNQRAERAPHINSFVFPLCWRCTGLIVGGMIATVVKLMCHVESNIWLTILASSPMAIDWFLQYSKLMESVNYRRFLTGFLFALGLIYLP